ncbi:MAG: hypothetical protein WC058_00795 [Phycisphaeraceae bacterium]
MSNARIIRHQCGAGDRIRFWIHHGEPRRQEEDDFTGQAPGAPTHWMYGVAPPALAVQTGVTWQVEDVVDPDSGVDEQLHLNIGTATANNAYDYHTNNRFNFNATGDKIIRLDVEKKAGQVRTPST